MQNRGVTKEGNENMSVPLACVPCRERHVKCDGLQPCCSRCSDSKQSCYYVRSRRGHRPARKRAHSEESSSSTSTSRRRDSTMSVHDGLEIGAYGAGMQSSPNVSPPSLHPASAMHSAFGGTPKQRSISRSPRPIMQRLPGPGVISPGPSSVRLRELYYFYFHDSHPILVPQLFLPQIHQSIMPAPVEAAMHYVASQYYRYSRDDCQYLQRLQTYLFAPGADRNRFTVQALVLLGIAQRAQDRNDLAYETLGQALDLAVQLGMNRAAFARENSEGSPVIEEMWRRVWWELYINDALLAATRQDTFFRMHTIEADVGLPCEEHEYKSCNPGISRSFRDLQESAFYEDSTAFSSFTYRIAAARNIALLLKLNQTSYADLAEPVASLDLALSNWMLHLPENKKIPLDSENKVDQMMFQAHMIANLSSICLNRPRSSLIFHSMQDAASWGHTRPLPPPSSKQTEHTAKAVEAADRISNLITLPGEALKHSPLFAVTIAMGSLVHLSAYVLSTDSEQTSLIRDRIALAVGALKGARYTWPLAGGVLDNLRTGAKEVMTAGRAAAAATAVLGSNIEYDTRPLESETWMAAMNDPLFTQIPELAADSLVPVTLGPHIATTFA